jgi:hypothetical protein
MDLLDIFMWVIILVIVLSIGMMIYSTVKGK